MKTSFAGRYNEILQSFNPINHSSGKHITKNARDKNVTFLATK